MGCPEESLSSSQNSRAGLKSREREMEGTGHKTHLTGVGSKLAYKGDLLNAVNG